MFLFKFFFLLYICYAFKKNSYVSAIGSYEPQQWPNPHPSAFTEPRCISTTIIKDRGYREAAPQS